MIERRGLYLRVRNQIGNRIRIALALTVLVPRLAALDQTADPKWCLHFAHTLSLTAQQP